MPASTGAVTYEFPPGETGYHTYLEMVDEIHDVEAAHPSMSGVGRMRAVCLPSDGQVGLFVERHEHRTGRPDADARDRGRHDVEPPRDVVAHAERPGHMAFGS